MSARAASVSTVDRVDPRPDDAIFRNVSFAAEEGPLSRYGDESWCLRPMAQKATSNPLKIDFTTIPETFRSTARRIVWTFINERTPIDDLARATATRSRLSAGTIASIFHDLRLFLSWLHERGVHRLSDVSDGDFRAYAGHIVGRAIVRGVKGRYLFSVTRIWLAAPYLPAEDQLPRPTWENPSDDTERIDQLLGPANWTGENKTLPVHPQTMSALLLAALRFIDVFAQDITTASALKEAMQASIPTAVGPEHHETVDAYHLALIADGGHLPAKEGRKRPRENGTNLAREYLSATLGVCTFALKPLDSSHLPLRIGAPMPTRIDGAIDGRPWCTAIDYYEVEQLRRMLMIACFIVVSYLSGMRIEECRALRRGCCGAAETDEGAPTHFEIRGHSFKDALDDEGNAIPGGAEREQPWVVLQPVAKALAIAESLHDGEHVFADAAFKPFRRQAGNPVTAAATRAGIRDFIAWWNGRCTDNERSHETIPADPDGEIVPARFRRTLAWFIYRVPGGRIALGIQYGHLRGYTSDGYASRVASGLRDVFPMEEALAVAEALETAARRLDDGEQVSGPAADRYIAGVRNFQHTFGGAYLTARQMAALRRNPSLRIYDNPGRALACVYDQTKALCHPDRDRGVPDSARTPDVTRCRDNCANTARTDTHADLLRAEIVALREEVASALTPEPIRIRLAGRIDRREQELLAHEQHRRPS